MYSSSPSRTYGVRQCPNTSTQRCHAAAGAGLNPSMYSVSMRIAVSRMSRSVSPQNATWSGTKASMICLASSTEHPSTWSPTR